MIDNYDLTVSIVETVVKEIGGDFEADYDLYWDALRNPILNILEKERPE